MQWSIQRCCCFVFSGVILCHHQSSSRFEAAYTAVALQSALKPEFDKKKKSANMVSGKSSLTDYFNSIQSPSCDSNVGQLVPLFQVSFELRRRAEFFFFFSWDQSCLCLVPAGMTDRDTYTTEFLYLMKDLQTVTHWGFVEYCGDVFYLQNM